MDLLAALKLIMMMIMMMMMIVMIVMELTNLARRGPKVRLHPWVSDGG